MQIQDHIKNANTTRHTRVKTRKSAKQNFNDYNKNIHFGGGFFFVLISFARWETNADIHHVAHTHTMPNKIWCSGSCTLCAIFCSFLFMFIVGGRFDIVQHIIWGCNACKWPLKKNIKSNLPGEKKIMENSSRNKCMWAQYMYKMIAALRLVHHHIQLTYVCLSVMVVDRRLFTMNPDRYEWSNNNNNNINANSTE